jgi:peptide/nickel transport system substrate-binding protein
MTIRRRTLWRAIAALAALATLAAACGDDDDDSGGATDTTAAAASTTAGGGGTATTASGTTAASTASTTATTAAEATPVKGGTITIGAYSNPVGLDPAKLAGGGTQGGIELSAIYDQIIRYDITTGKYEPRTGEFTPNADFSDWTLKIKPNIKFTDGTAYDSAAVKFVIDRQLKEGNPSPRGQLAAFVDTVTVVDPLTVDFKLKRGYADFPYLFTGPAGWIYSPAAFAKAGSADNFNVNPGDAGAGPFKVKAFKPGESIELVRNDSYYGGQVYLDGIKSVTIAGAQPSYDAVKSGTLQAAFIRSPLNASQAPKDGLENLEMPAIAGQLINMNSGVKIACKGGQPSPACDGKADGEMVPTVTATANVHVRQAVAASVDNHLLNQRMWQGTAEETTSPFEGAPLDPGVPGTKYDLEKAKALVTQAKGEGWDGKIRLLSQDSPEGVTFAQIVEAELKAAGMDVTTTVLSAAAGDIVNRVIVQKDYDATTWAYGMLDDFPSLYLQLVGTFNSANPRYGYGNAEMDAALDKMRTAKDDTERKAALKGVAEIWVRDVPAVVNMNIMQTWVHSAKLHGAYRTGNSIVLLDKAWLSQ